MAEKLPRSEGRLSVDSQKCAGCMSCMLACSLVHEGVENLDLSRIQVIRDIFGDYPGDIQVAVCRQCPRPLCVESCPTEPKACHIDTAHGNVRVIDVSLCNGCRKCVEACPFTPHMPIWNSERNIATKCDLCIDTPYWGEEGGPGGKQACINICPMDAIKLIKTGQKQDGVNETEVARK